MSQKQIYSILPADQPPFLQNCPVAKSRFSEKEIKDLHGIGPNAVNELRRALKASGLSFAKK
ncbi:MAG TPA: hypothetical protein VFR47_27765 [Anaerolineales bacterium]|nr:hypothetical protein [Anaerolineales bacterium]